MSYKYNLKTNTYDGEFEVIKNKINILVGKNNVGKTTILNDFQEQIKKNKNLDTYYLSLNTEPFQPLIKQPTDLQQENKLTDMYYLIGKKYIELRKNENEEIQKLITSLQKNYNLDNFKSDF
jgi:predicted ATP-dependent endonuclease of OLD family